MLSPSYRQCESVCAALGYERMRGLEESASAINGLSVRFEEINEVITRGSIKMINRSNHQPLSDLRLLLRLPAFVIFF